MGGRAARAVIALLAVVLFVSGCHINHSVAVFSAHTTAEATLSALTVASPTNVQVQVISCRGRDVEFEVSWTGSPTTGVSGYRLTAYFQDGTTANLGQTGAGTTAATVIGSVPNGSTVITLAATVTALTTYGWTAPSPRSAWITC